MVAGMVMPIADLRAIYELLFRDGVMVTKKDKRPQCMHPEIQGVANLKVIRTMGSLKSRGFVRETFAWKHAYFYLTNEGIVYLRDYLHLPAEIVPSSLQRIRRPASTLDVMRRAARVQTVEGPTSYVPKPRAGRESQEAMVERQGYRHKRGPGGEEEAVSDRPPMRFRGSYQPRGPTVEPGVPTQTFFRRGQGLRRGEERWAEEPGQGRGGFRSSNLPPESRAVRPPAPAREVKPPTPEIPVSVPLEPKIPKEVVVPAAVDVEVFPPALAAPAVIPLVKAVEPVEQVEIKPTVEEEEQEEEQEEEEEDDEEEVVTEELVEKASAWLEEEEPKPAVKELAEELTEEAIQPAVVTEEEEIIQAFHVKEIEEEPHGASEPEEEEEEEEEEDDEEEEEEEEDVVVVKDVTEEEDVVVVEDVPEEDSSDEDSLQEVEIEKDIEILEEPKELVPEAAIEELEPEPVMPAAAEEAESQPVINTEAMEVEAPIPLTKADTPDPDSDVDLPSPPPSVSDDVTDLSEQHVDSTAEHMIHEETTVPDATPETSYMLTPKAVTVTEEVVSTTTISQSYGVVETSTTANIVSDLGLEKHASFEASFAGPSECPIAALRSSLPQGDWGFLTEDPLDEQEVTKVWPDSLEG
ncbi:cyclic nucleotide-gated channel beta-1-like isoform X2 [Osmerus mordax]|uniref:cyclic nucleotide-gated channel beta-1-like isoform X2 n=1 Tax=Osmerus mordax TaxID=8014 RepID=UPI00350EEFEC